MIKNRRTVLGLYLMLVFAVVILKFDGNIPKFLQEIQQQADYREMWGEAPHNYIPLRTISMYIQSLPSAIALKNLFGNIIPFIPLGALLPWSVPTFQNTKRFLFACALLFAGAELLQYFTYTGSLDIDDWILNLLGCCIGFLAYKLRSRSAQT